VCFRSALPDTDWRDARVPMRACMRVCVYACVRVCVYGELRARDDDNDDELELEVSAGWGLMYVSVWRDGSFVDI
jgi:hypothetical protein